jgi:hypothetical protein
MHSFGMALAINLPEVVQVDARTFTSTWETRKRASDAMSIWDGVSGIIKQVYDDVTGETARKHREKEEELNARFYDAWAKHAIACGLYQIADAIAIAGQANPDALMPEELRLRSAVASDREPTIDTNANEASR